MKIAISAESTCDLAASQIKENDIKIIPYYIILGDEEICDDSSVPARIFEYVSKTKKLPKTSAINEAAYKEYFENILKDYDAVIHFTLSSSISSSHSNAVKASKQLKNVYIIDSKSLSTGIGLLMLYAKKLSLEGLSPQEIVSKTEKRVDFVQASFVIEKLDYLYKGGRCNALALFGANLLKIRPQIILSDGKMKPAKKYRGSMEKVVKSYCEDTLKEYNTPDKTIVFITHTTATPEMVSAARKCLEEAGFTNIVETTAGGTITSHCGENVLGILYINDGNKIN